MAEPAADATLRMVVLGRQGSGKGTQAARLSATYGPPHVSTGDAFRAAAASGSELGRTLKSYMDRGELVPDDVVVGVIREHLFGPGAPAGFILDGFPRTVAQAEALAEMASLRGIDIVIDQLEFGADTESKQAVPLPIKLAVSLLKDRNGVIDLELPVGGSLDDPTFRIGPIIWKVFVNLIEKVVTAPFAALGKLFGGGPELSYVDFPAGASTLGPDQAQKLSQLASALVERPQVKLNVPLHTQADDDDAALERLGLDKALQVADASGAAAARPRSPKSKTGAGASSEATGAPTAAQLPVLVALYRTQFKSDPVYPPETQGGADPDADKLAWLQQQLLPQFAPSQAERDALGLARAQAVQSAMLANTDLKSDRVFLVNQVSGGGLDGKVRMELKLE